MPERPVEADLGKAGYQKTRLKNMFARVEKPRFLGLRSRYVFWMGWTVEQISPVNC